LLLLHLLHLGLLVLRAYLVQLLNHLLYHLVILLLVCTIVVLLHPIWVVLMPLHFRSISQQLVRRHLCHVVCEIGGFEGHVAFEVE